MDSINQIPQEQEAAGKKKKKKEKEKKSLGMEILSWIGTILLAVAVAILIRSFVFQPVRVDGHSMDDTLADGEIMFVTRFDYSTTWVALPWADAETQEKAPRIPFGGAPSRFDVVICRYPGRGGTNFVKRVVGLPGDTVAFEGGWLYVNGEKQEESYINDDYRKGLNSELDTYRVPAKGDTLVVKDNRLLVNGEIWRWRGGYLRGVSDDGQKLEYNQGALYLSGKEITTNSELEALEGKEFKLPEDYYFVCGDHRNNSNDSRSVGPITRSMVIGHVRRVLFSDWRAVQ